MFICLLKNRRKFKNIEQLNQPHPDPPQGEGVNPIKVLT